MPTVPSLVKQFDANSATLNVDINGACQNAALDNRVLAFAFVVGDSLFLVFQNVN